MEKVWINRGVANRINGKIYLHKDLQLPEYEDLLEEIIEHEEAHDDGKYSEKDFTLDMYSRIKHGEKLFDFMIHRPSTWWQMSPLFPSPDGWCMDWSVLFMWTCFVAPILFMVYMVFLY